MIYLENFDENIVDRTKVDEYKHISKVKDTTLEGMYFFLGIPESKSKLATLLISKRNENKKIMFPRD